MDRPRSSVPTGASASAALAPDVPAPGFGRSRSLRSPPLVREGGLSTRRKGLLSATPANSLFPVPRSTDQDTELLTVVSRDAGLLPTKKPGRPGPTSAGRAAQTGFRSGQFDHQSRPMGATRG